MKSEEPSHHSVTNWLHQLAAGNDSAATQQLWNRYFSRLAALARVRLSGAPQRVSDEEDVVVSVMESFFQGARAGRFPDLKDRSGLWPLLVKITARKSINQIKFQHAKKRGGGVREHVPDIEELVGDEPSPQFAAEVSEQMDVMLQMLGDDTLRRIAIMKLEGYTNPEIAAELDVAERTIARKLARVRAEWNELVDESDAVD
ncbi:MAG: hypothetical protein KDA61_14825 [Planctomycetales bacterium]|nr:hypothetical protein [Planctomycetales bacterium]